MILSINNTKKNVNNQFSAHWLCVFVVVCLFVCFDGEGGFAVIRAAAGKIGYGGIGEFE